MKTPVPINNRPGLAALHYRVGTYGDFRESMLARLSDSTDTFRPLNRLRTRSPDDPTVALIDAFAMLGEILTFYQERLANEGFLRTATEPRSVAELARLTGYRLRPGVASSVVLAFTLAPNSSVTLPAGSRAQSVPGSGQTAQTFETTSDLGVSDAWNAMQPRMTRPTQPTPELGSVAVSGISTGLKPNDPVLLVVNSTPMLRRVAALAPDAARQRTVITFQTAPAPPTTAAPSGPAAGVSGPAAMSAPNPASAAAAAAPPSPDTLVTQQAAAFASLARIPPAAHPPNAQALTRSAAQLFAPGAESALTLAAGVTPAQRQAVFRSLATTQLAPMAPLEVHAFRASTAPFGNRAPPQVMVDASGQVQPPQEWQLSGPTYGPEVLFAIEIMPEHNGRVPLASFLRSVGATLARGGSISEGVALVSTITFDAVTLTLTLTGEPGNQTSGTLSAALGDVSVKLARLATRPELVMELVYTFSRQPLTISVLQQGSDSPKVTNLQQTDALVTLEANEDATPVWRVLGSLRPLTGTQPAEVPNVLYLDGTFETITPGTWVAFDAPADPTLPAPPAPIKVTSVNTVSRTAYGQTARTSRLGLSGSWIDPANTTFARAIRQTAVYADSAPLTLVDEDITDPVTQTAEQPMLELDGLVTGLSTGRWLAVSGERTDMPGVTAQEVVMLAGVNHGGETVGTGSVSTVAAGETPHTVLTFSNPLAYSYKRETVQVFGNVAPATQGESTDEILGSGNGASTNQTFTLKKPPVTYVAAATPSGSANTLRIWVNNIEWQEVDALAAAAPDARVFVTTTTADGTVTVQFGDGVHGARLPTGTENIRARYRSGLGQSGNLDPGTITTLLSRPLGVNSVINPGPASGGADAEGPDSARANIPLGLVSLARLVSLPDYQDFATAFAGIGKAAVRRFAGPDGPLIHLTLAGAGDATLDPSGALWQALDGAVRQFGDPALEVELAPRVARLAVIQAHVAVDPDQQWTDVEPAVRAALLDTFSFSQRALGQTLYVSEVIAAIQAIDGVSHVDLQVLTDVPQPTDIDQLRAAITAGGARDLLAHAARVDPSFRARPRRLLPADLIYLSDILADMLVLSEITS
jgi:hypothetical protein